MQGQFFPIDIWKLKLKKEKDSMQTYSSNTFKIALMMTANIGSSIKTKWIGHIYIW